MTSTTRLGDSSAKEIVERLAGEYPDVAYEKIVITVVAALRSLDLVGGLPTDASRVAQQIARQDLDAIRAAGRHKEQTV